MSNFIKMERSPEKIQVSGAENGFIPQQQIENKSLESSCRKEPEGRRDTDWIEDDKDGLEEGGLYVNVRSFTVKWFILFKACGFFPFRNKYLFEVAFMKYDNHILLEGEKEFKNISFFRASYLKSWHIVYSKTNSPTGTVHSSGELRFW